MDGFFIIDKPKNMTSFDLCNIVKKKLNTKKVGHFGTLDPNATGVMVVAVNKATKLLRLIEEDSKEYISTIIFGLDSTSLDMDGKITKDVEMKLDINDIKKALDELLKKKAWIPPMTSAIKVNGKKLYEYQYKNIEVEVLPREGRLFSYELKSDLRYIDNHYEIDVLLKVSRGFYIRSLARDLGMMLDGCAIVKELRRISTGGFNLDKAISIDEINETKLITIEEFFDFPKVIVDDYIAKLVKNGVELDERQTTISGNFYVCDKFGIIAIYEEKEKNKYKPVLIF